MAILLFGLSIKLLLNKKFKPIITNTIDISLLLLYLYILLRTVFTPYTPIFHNLKFINYTLFVILYFIVKNIFSISGPTNKSYSTCCPDKASKTRRIRVFDILLILLMLSGLVQAIWGLMQLYDFLPSFHSNFKITGTFFNPAPYAIYLAAIFPMALGIFLRIKEKRESILNTISFYVSITTVVAISLILPATLNRASWLGALVGSFLVLNQRYNIIKRTRDLFTSNIRGFLALLFLVLFIGSLIVGLYFIKKGSSEGRLLIWEVTACKIVDRPLFGYGVGRFEAEYNNWQADYFKNHPEVIVGPKAIVAGNTKYCFNEYLELTAEVGLIGLFLFILVIVLVLRNNKFQQTGQPEDVCNKYNLLSPSLITLLVCALVSIPFYSLPTSIVFFIILALLSSQTNDLGSLKWSSDSNLVPLFYRVVGFLFFTIGSLLISVKADQYYKAFQTWHEAEILYQTGNYNESCQPFSEVASQLKYTGACLQHYGKALNLSEQYQLSIEYMEQARNYTSDEILFTTLGDSYKALMKFNKAEDAYIHAYYMVPHKLYPRYLLTKLYAETGQNEKAVETGKDVLTSKVKVESEATKQIFAELRALVKMLEGDQ